jgi:hypothetical protein
MPPEDGFPGPNTKFSSRPAPSALNPRSNLWRGGLLQRRVRPKHSPAAGTRRNKSLTRTTDEASSPALCLGWRGKQPDDHRV